MRGPKGRRDEASGRTFTLKKVEYFRLNVKKIMRDREMLLKQLAHDSTLSYSSLSRTLVGVYAPSIECALLVSKALNVSLDELFKEVL